MKESRLSLLVSNIIIYGFNQVLVVLIPMMMLPIYSRLLPDIRIYGISSLATTMSTLFSSIATFGMFDAAVRFAFDEHDNKKAYQKEICSTATFFMFCTSTVVGFLLIIFREVVSKAFYSTTDYSMIVVIAAGMTIFTVWNTSSLIPIRINNQKKIAVVNSIIKAISTAVVTIILILLRQYIVAIPLGTLIALLLTWLVTFFLIQKKYIDTKYINFTKMKEMLKYAAPLMITFISYWIYQSADKIMLSHLSDLNEVGIYSIGAKVGSVSGVIQNAFASGWAYFAFSTMNDKDQIQLISKIFRIGMFICCVISMVVMAFIYPIFDLIFADGDYLQGAYLCASLFTAPLFLTLMQIIGTQFLIKKDTKFYSGVQMIGAIVNIIFNSILIPEFGARGAAVGTLIGYAVPLILLILFLIKCKRIFIKFRTLIVFGLSFLLLIISTLFVDDWKLCLMIGGVAASLIIILSKKEMLSLVHVLCSYLKKD